MRRSRIYAVTVCVMAVAGCEYFGSDVATRVRYALDREVKAMEAAGEPERSFAIRPDHWPDACPGDAGYTLTLSPYRGGKAVEVGDIRVDCVDGGPYWTGMGSERIYVGTDLVIAKRADEDLVITLRRTEAGAEITNLR